MKTAKIVFWVAVVVLVIVAFQHPGEIGWALGRGAYVVTHPNRW